MTTFVTADQHWGHFNIIRLCDRPFSGLSEMHDVMIANWNEVVDYKDTVYVLGDWAWSKQTGAWAESHLNGNLVFLAGSHDWNRKKLPLMLRLTENKVTYYMSHWPLETWQPHTIMLHGHSHGNLPRKRWRCDVGVDCWDFTPITLETAREYAEFEIVGGPYE